MKSKRKFMLMFLMLFMGIMICGNVSAQAEVKNIMYYAHSLRTLSVDITGDGKSETIQYNPTVKYGALQSFELKVNKKKALSVDLSKNYCYDVNIKSIKIGKNVFLEICASSDNCYIVFNRLYKYNKSTKKFTSVLNLSSNGHTSGEVIKVSGNTIEIYNERQFLEIGKVKWYDSYKWSNGKFVKAIKSPSVTSCLGGYSFYTGDNFKSSFAKNMFMATKKITFYTKAGGKTKAFVLPKGAYGTLTKLYRSGDKFYVQFTYNGKKGWRKIGNDYKSVYGNSPISGTTGWFYGVGNRMVG